MHLIKIYSVKVLRYVMIGVIGFFFLAMILYVRRAKRIGKYITFFNDYISKLLLKFISYFFGEMGQVFAFLIVNFLVEIAFLLFGLFLFVSVMSSGVVETVDAPSNLIFINIDENRFKRGFSQPRLSENSGR